MACSTSMVLRPGCSRLFSTTPELFSSTGGKDHSAENGRIKSDYGALSCRCELKSEVKVSAREGEERKCSSLSRKQCVLLKESEKACGGPAEAARCARNDALLVCAAAHNLDERARSDLFLLSQEISRLDMRARKAVALLGIEFLKLDARAREDVEKLDLRARKKMTRLRHIALGLKESARMELSSAAEEHWSDGALDADLRLADLRARRRAMEDLYAALQVVKNVQSALVSTLQLRANKVLPEADRASFVSLDGDENQGFRQLLKTSNPMLDRLTAIEDAYWRMASALVEAEGVDCSDPDELEFIVAALLDMEEVDGGGGALLVAECASSPDVATRLVGVHQSLTYMEAFEGFNKRRALADALADAPSLWTLGNAGMGALQRLSEDSNPTVADAASKAINELKLQWQKQHKFFFPSESDDNDESG